MNRIVMNNTKMTRTLKKSLEGISIGGFGIVFLTLGGMHTAYATQATIQVSPISGNHTVGDSFSVNVTLRDPQTEFNAAQANVNVSSNLAVNGLTLGNCQFAFVRTPTTSNPSFTGTMLGTSSKDCTVYTLQLKAVGSGTGNITISNGSVKAFSGSAELFSSAQSGSYMIAASTTTADVTVTPVPTTALPGASTTNNQNKQYSINLTIADENSQPIPGAQVSMDNGQQFTADENGVATIIGVPGGVRKIIVTKSNGEYITEQVLNVEGEDEVLTLGVSTSKDSKTSFPWALLVIAVLGTTVLGYFILRRTNLFR